MSHATISSFIMSVLMLCTTFLNPSQAQTNRNNTFHPGQTMRFAAELTSPGGKYKLAFFTPEAGSSFLGISDTSYSINVWVANRTVPITDTNANLTMDVNGVLTIRQAEKASIGLNVNAAAVNSVASLEDSGNLVVSELNADGSIRGVMWQSFDYPTDTLFPGMNLGKEFSTGKVLSLRSWLTDINPAPGVFSMDWEVTVNNTVELVMKRRGEVYWTSGLLERDNRVFQNLPLLSQNFLANDYQFHYVSNSSESSFFYTIIGDRNSWWKMEPKGRLWDTTQAFLLNEDVCLGFSSATSGCHNVENSPKCRRRGDKFEARTGYFERSPLHYTDLRINVGLTDCWAECWKNCSCIAYEMVGAYCRYWDAQAKFIPDESTRTDYFVLNSSLPTSKESMWWIWVIVGLVAALLVLLFGFLVYYRRKKLIEERARNEEEILIELTTSDQLYDSTEVGEDGKTRRSVKVFSFASIQAATRDFSPENKLGQGGFGPVYKGRFPEGQEIAVKRLSSGSGQGLVEFKNEIILIAKLQHMNLVRLLGCCIFKDEKMLIYEYMSNKSLDFFLFDSTKRSMLGWKMRFSIIEGIAQGLLYLHKYSRLRIIHRDLKASNILLDKNMVSKISDFGMAKIFGREDTEAITNRVVGTYGYMAPEYAMEGVFSDKSDVYSFGVLLLEIISGRKNSSFHHYDRAVSLVAYASETWKDRTCLDIMDPTFVDFSTEQILRCIHIALLCVQDDPADRPNMSDIVSTLTNERMPLPEPNEPAYLTQKNKTYVKQPSTNESYAHSLISITTDPEAR
ncbi:unnamed protein product [Rhodiola kirilowii]